MTRDPPQFHQQALGSFGSAYTQPETMQQEHVRRFQALGVAAELVAALEAETLECLERLAALRG